MSVGPPRRCGTASPEAAVIADCLAGRTAAFGALVGRYQDRLYNTVYRLVDHAEDALDVVQEAFLHAYQSLGSFKGDARFFTWLYRIAVNTALSHNRKRLAAKRLGARRTGGVPAPFVPPTQTGSGHDPLELADREHCVNRSLARLSADHRAVLVMKVVEGQRYSEIAGALGVPIGTVRSRLNRARLELRELLEQDDA